MSKFPAYYRAPLKKRKDIEAFLADRGYSDRHTHYPLSWNVKAHSLNFDFDHLLSLHKDEMDERASDPEWLAKAEKRLEDEETQVNLFNWAIEAAQRSVTDDDGYRCLCDGTELQVEWGFYGRQGGHLCLEEFNGFKFNGESEQFFLGLDFATLRLLYRFVVQCDHDFRPEAVKAEVEYNAAFSFFENLCSDIEWCAVEDEVGSYI